MCRNQRGPLIRRYWIFPIIGQNVNGSQDLGTSGSGTRLQGLERLVEPCKKGCSTLKLLRATVLAMVPDF